MKKEKELYWMCWRVIEDNKIEYFTGINSNGEYENSTDEKKAYHFKIYSEAQHIARGNNYHTGYCIERVARNI